VYQAENGYSLRELEIAAARLYGGGDGFVRRGAAGGAADHFFVVAERQCRARRAVAGAANSGTAEFYGHVPGAGGGF